MVSIKRPVPISNFRSLKQPGLKMESIEYLLFSTDGPEEILEKFKCNQKKNPTGKVKKKLPK